MRKLQHWLNLANMLTLGLACLLYDRAFALPVLMCILVSYSALFCAHEIEHLLHIREALASHSRPFFINFPVLPGSPTFDGDSAGEGVSMGANLDLILRARVEPMDDEKSLLVFTYAIGGRTKDRTFVVRPEVASAVAARVTRDKA